MSFLKITDPEKRNFIIEQFLHSKKNIQQNYLSEKLGDVCLQRELTKLYKPIIDTQSRIARELGVIKESTAATTNALQALPTSMSSSLKAIQFCQFHSSICKVRLLALRRDLVAPLYRREERSSSCTTSTSLVVTWILALRVPTSSPRSLFLTA